MTRRRTFFLIGILLSLAIAGVASYYASSAPDGLEKVAADRGFEETAEDHALADGPLADYGTRGVDDARLSGGLAGVAGIAVTLVVAGGLFFLLTRGRTGRRQDDPPAAAGAPEG